MKPLPFLLSLPLLMAAFVIPLQAQAQCAEPDPVIYLQPHDTFVCKPGTAALYSNATWGEYTWEYFDGVEWAGIADGVPVGITYGGTTVLDYGSTAVLTYNVSASTGSGIYLYRGIVTNPASCNPDTTEVVSLFVFSSPQILECPGDTTVSTEPGLCQAVVGYPPAVFVGVPVGSVFYSQDSGTVFPHGITTVTVTVENLCGTTGCSFDVEVIDLEPPVVSFCPPDDTLYLDEDCSLPLADYTSLMQVTDNCSASPPDTGSNVIVITQSPLPGTALSTAGITEVTLTATDASGNSSFCTFHLTVFDTTAPVAACKAFEVALSGGVAIITGQDVDDGSSDNCGIASYHVTPSSFTCDDIGEHEVTLSVTDSSGNTSTCQAIVAVLGAIPSCSIDGQPTADIININLLNTIVLGLGPQSTILNSTTTGGSSFTYAWTGSSLSCYDCEDPVFTPTASGNYTFTLTVTNEFGCSSSCDITICVINVFVPHGPGLNVYVCHNTPGGPSNTIQLNVVALVAYLISHPNDHLGSCSFLCGDGKTDEWMMPLELDGEETDMFAVRAYPNPFSNQIHVAVASTNTEKIDVKVFDVAGQLVDERSGADSSTELILGSKLATGMYMIEVKQGDRKEILRVVKSE